jgi:outer membrane protein OmpA-like peptidoglycan-associated protein
VKLTGETVSNNKQWTKTAPLALAAGLICLAPAALHAQNGVNGKPGVVVDNSVLDQLGPPSNLPELLLKDSVAPEFQQILLTPPHGQKPAAGKGKKHHFTAEDLAQAPGGESAVHLHPIKPHHAAVKQAKVEKPVPVAAKESAPAALTPTLSQAPTPTAPPPAAVTSEPLAPPPSKSKNPVTTPVPQAPAAAPAPTPTAPPPAAATSGSPTALALTAQPPSTEPTATAPAQESLSTITFDKDSARLPDAARDTLAHLASRMGEDATLEVLVLGYAAGDEENASKARRLSLSRALAVRSFLIDQGVRRTRIEVRALGNKVPEGAPDRVDIEMQKRG